jgi:hypothetical protein
MRINSKLDLLVRVRYSNPLPAPPCPPKLLDVPTDPMRYARSEFLNDIANDTPLPMIVDAECGMPLDLGKWECLWEQDADDSGAQSVVIHGHTLILRFVISNRRAKSRPDEPTDVGPKRSILTHRPVILIRLLCHEPRRLCIRNLNTHTAAARHLASQNRISQPRQLPLDTAGRTVRLRVPS